jgi:hypothetical protein
MEGNKESYLKILLGLSLGKKPIKVLIFAKEELIHPAYRNIYKGRKQEVEMVMILGEMEDTLLCSS